MLNQNFIFKENLLGGKILLRMLVFLEYFAITIAY
jgi:hypothetical protein